MSKNVKKAIRVKIFTPILALGFCGKTFLVERGVLSTPLSHLGPRLTLNLPGWLLARPLVLWEGHHYFSTWSTHHNPPDMSDPTGLPRPWSF